MVKSVLINDNVHKILVDKQYILSNIGIKIGLSDLAEKIIVVSIEEYIDKLMKKEEGK